MRHVGLLDGESRESGRYGNKSRCYSNEKGFSGIKKLRETTAERFAGGVVVYAGEHMVGFGEKLYAVPIRALWETV